VQAGGNGLNVEEAGRWVDVVGSGLTGTDDVRERKALGKLGTIFVNAFLHLHPRHKRENRFWC